MELIVLTHPETLPGEAGIINQLLARGLARLHVRKPDATEAELRALLKQIEPQFLRRLALHQHHKLASEFGITGLHFTEKNRLAQSGETLEVLKSNGFTLSTSIHDPEALEVLSHYFDYVFLGPVFDSISKAGYSSNLPADFKLQKHNFPGKVIALGGIDAENLKSAREMSFDGAAMLGRIWQNPENAVAQFKLLRSLQSSPKSSFLQSSCIPGLKPGAMDFALELDAFSGTFEEKQINSKAKAVHCPEKQTNPKAEAVHCLEKQTDPKAKAVHCPEKQTDPKAKAVHCPEKQTDPKAKAVHCPGFQSGDRKKKEEVEFVDRLHFISNETGSMSHIDSIRLALEAGCRWIQLRVKNRPQEEVLPIASEARRLCDNYGAKLIINDFPQVALAVEAHGLHLGLTDMPVPEARALVGEQMVIGGTANTWEDITLRIGEGADYIGLGPFRFTNTKQNLSPILGIEGYDSLMRQMQAAGHSTPIIAIGGITPDDIGGLRTTGLHGVALSAALIGAADPRNTFYQIQQALC